MKNEALQGEPPFSRSKHNGSPQIPNRGDTVLVEDLPYLISDVLYQYKKNLVTVLLLVELAEAKEETPEPLPELIPSLEPPPAVEPSEPMPVEEVQP